MLIFQLHMNAPQSVLCARFPWLKRWGRGSKAFLELSAASSKQAQTGSQFFDRKLAERTARANMESCLLIVASEIEASGCTDERAFF